MTANEAILLMTESVNNDKKNNFYSIVERYLSSLSKSGEVYYKLHKAIKNKPNDFVKIENLSADIKKLLRTSEQSDSFCFLNENISMIFDELYLEYECRESFKYHNIPIRNKLLLFGETGNGKTTIARSFSKRFNLPFVEVNSDMIIDSHLGSTGVNINKIFSQLNEPCILFWDEVDTIGRKRGAGSDNSAGMENERMVNSILVNLEKMNKDIFFIGATNRKNVLDDAFLRRFDILINVPPPNNMEKILFCTELISYHNLPICIGNGIDLFPYNSFSQLKSVMMDSARKYITKTVLFQKNQTE